MRFLQIIIALFFSVNLYAQDYISTILAHREAYKSEFLKDERSPLVKDELKYLRFYTPDVQYKVEANIELIVDTVGFEMQTHSGVLKHYYIYGKASFELNKQPFELYIYQSEKLKSKEGFEDYLFIPFTDKTNYSETFGGGRYLDFKIGDIKQGKMEIDFNKCYNPYCAFKSGYSCPIPPQENDLKIDIKAGEKLFGKKIKE